VNCELTFLEREPIDFDRALAQHDGYCRALADCGAVVRTLNVNAGMPDSVFVEDTAVVLDEIAVLASMGAESRRGEPAALARELARYREVKPIRLPARLDGGDVVVTGRTIFVGLTGRTDMAGVDAMRDITSKYGYSVHPVRVTGCLHLKSACTALPDGRLLVNPSWLELADLRGMTTIPIDAREPFAGDVACVGDVVVASDAFPLTNAGIASLGFEVREVDLSEFARAEGGVTCLSLIFRGSPAD
jgi:dimethylargininase